MSWTRVVNLRKKIDQDNDENLYVGLFHDKTYLKQFTASETVMPHHAIDCSRKKSNGTWSVFAILLFSSTRVTKTACE